jgi:hypothetical protein
MSLGFSLLEYNACFRRRGLQRCIAWLRRKQMQLKNRIRDEFLGTIDKNVKENQIIQKNVFIAFRMT